MKHTLSIFAAFAALAASAITTTLEYEDARETLTRAAVSNDLAQAVTNLDARPVPITPQTSGRGVTFVDQYGEDQNVAVAIGAGAQAAVTTNAVEAAADNKVIRSTGVAVGGPSVGTRQSRQSTASPSAAVRTIPATTTPQPRARRKQSPLAITRKRPLPTPCSLAKV